MAALNKKKGFKFWVGRLHLWLGLASGLLVCFLGITGCILAFEREFEDAFQPYRFTKFQQKKLLPPTRLKALTDSVLPNKKAHSIVYQTGRTAQVVYYNDAPEYYFIVFVNQYTGKIEKVKDMSQDFFRIVINGHYYLWLPPAIGQPILTSATLIFVILLISGLILWWPKSRAAKKQRFKIKFNARWRRVNYDLHNILGFYITWIIIFIALSGMVMGFQWFANSVYFVSSGGKSIQVYEEALSDTTKVQRSGTNYTAADRLWAKFVKADPTFEGTLDVHVPATQQASIEIAKNPDPATYWKTDYFYFDQYTLKEIEVKHSYGKLAKANTGDKLLRMNYDIHVGAIAGLPGKILAFLASLIAASLPITGTIIWLGRKRKAAKTNKATS